MWYSKALFRAIRMTGESIVERNKAMAHLPRPEYKLPESLKKKQ